MRLENVIRKVSSASVVGIGESTHGTHEFFNTKTSIFTELVTNHGFNTFMLEDRHEQCQDINEYIKTGNGNLKELMRNLYSVWRVEELAELIGWMRDNYSIYQVDFVGFDIDQDKENTEIRDELMAKKIIGYIEQSPDAKIMIWGHNTHIKTSSEINRFRPMGMFLRKMLSKDYCAIAQFFGTGIFSAAIINKSDPNSRDRTLKQVRVTGIPSRLLEKKLNNLENEPYFLEKEKFKPGGLSGQNFIRSIGWGLIPDRLDEYIEKCNIEKEFDGLIYFPVTTRSKPI